MEQASCLAEHERLNALRAEVVARGLDHDRPTLGLTGLIGTSDTADRSLVASCFGRSVPNSSSAWAELVSYRPHPSTRPRSPFISTGRGSRPLRPSGVWSKPFGLITMSCGEVGVRRRAPAGAVASATVGVSTSRRVTCFSGLYPASATASPSSSSAAVIGARVHRNAPPTPAPAGHWPLRACPGPAR